MDPNYPNLHLRPSRDWVSDPNGPIHWRGQYHLFFQYNPAGPQWGPTHWGHALSDDLLHWELLPIALSPTPGGPDEAGCWSGCAVDNEGVLTLIYSGITNAGTQTVCLATSSDGISFTKDSANPVLGAPPDMDLVGMHDPFVWFEAGAWRMVIGSGSGSTGMVLRFRSEDLRQWEHEGVLHQADGDQVDPTWSGATWECPQFFGLGDEHVLIVSVWDGSAPRPPLYFVGKAEGGQLRPRMTSRFDAGPDFYAPSTFVDRDGRRICWGWSWEARTADAQVAAGWAGAITFPRVLSLGPAGDLIIEPARELRSLRGEVTHLPGEDVSVTQLGVDASGTALEILAEFEHPTAPVGVIVRASPDLAEATILYYDPTTQEVIFDRENSSLDAASTKGRYSSPISLAPSEPLRLNVFIDGSLVEAFVNDRLQLTGRVYPTREDSVHVGVFVEGGAARMRSMDVWKLRL